MHKKSLVRLINSDLRTTYEIGNIPYNIKSHSFRINMISSLLKTRLFNTQPKLSAITISNQL
jgi:hypothetical protein